jgi:hypothetical protein
MTSNVDCEPVNPYQSPEAAVHVAKMRRLPAFLTGLVGLAVGAGFYWVLCGFLVVAFLADAPAIPSPRERLFMVGAAILYGIPLVWWIAFRRRLFRLQIVRLWVLGIACWLLIPLSAAIMIFSLGM